MSKFEFDPDNSPKCGVVEMTLNEAKDLVDQLRSGSPPEEVKDYINGRTSIRSSGTNWELYSTEVLYRGFMSMTVEVEITSKNHEKWETYIVNIEVAPESETLVKCAEYG